MNVPPLTPSVHAADLRLENLAGNSNVSEQDKIAEVSRQFEAVLLRQILASAQKTHFASKLSDNSTTSGIYKDMVTAQPAEGISKSGALELAKTLSQQMKHEIGGEHGRSATVAKPSRSTQGIHTTNAPASPHLNSKAAAAGAAHTAALRRIWLHTVNPKGHGKS